MGGQTTKSFQKAVTDIISSVVSNTISNTATQSSSSGLNIQFTSGNNCNQTEITNYTSVFIVSQNTFQDATTYQTAINDIVTQIQSQADMDNSKVFTKDQIETSKEIIQNTVQNILTSTVLDSIITDISNSQTTIQVCYYGSSNTNQFAFTKRTDISSVYYSISQSNRSVQQTATTVANALSVTQSETQEGVLVELVKAIVAIIAFLIIVVVVGVVGYLVIQGKMMGGD